MRRSIRTLGVALALGLIAASANAAFSRAGKAKVAFQATGPGGLKFEGQTTDFQVKEEKDLLVLIVPLANLDTGIGLRNRHMKEKYLEVPKYPAAELSVAKSSLRSPKPGAPVEGKGNGKLKLHGQEKPVAFSYAAKALDQQYQVDATMHLDMRDFGIATPSYLGVKVKPDVDVTASFGLKE